MLKITNTENFTGIKISGTYEDIQEVYDAISNVLGPNHFFRDSTAFRVMGLTYDLRKCYMGDREIELEYNGYNEGLQEYYEIDHPDTNIHFSVNVLWLEAIFLTLAMDDYIKKYENNSFFNRAFRKSDFDDKKEYYEKTRFTDIAVVRMFQEKIWNAFAEVCGAKVCKSVRNKAKKTVAENGFNYVDYHIQYVDILHERYFETTKEKRRTLLASMTRKIINKGNDYIDLAIDIDRYRKENNLSIEDVRLNTYFPDEIEW